MEVSCDENDAKEAMSIVVNEPQHDLHQLTHGQVLQVFTIVYYTKYYTRSL